MRQLPFSQTALPDLTDLTALFSSPPFLVIHFHFSLGLLSVTLDGNKSVMAEFRRAEERFHSDTLSVLGQATYTNQSISRRIDGTGNIRENLSNYSSSR
jgi:hypothetical protein